jgi:hypothetical protein
MQAGSERYAGVAMRMWCALVLVAVGCAAQENTGSISGTVMDAGSFVIPNVTVTLSGPLTFEVQSDENGKFVFSRLEAGVYKLKFHMAGFEDRSLDVTADQRPILLDNTVLHIAMGDDFGMGERVILRSTSANGGNIYGMVRHRSAGVAKAIVILQLSGESPYVKITRTDTRGNFQLTEVQAGLYDLTIEADGFKRTNIESIGLQRERDVILPALYLLRSPIR